MANKPVIVPEWNRTQANNVQPSNAKQDLGWVVDEDPSSSFFNWLMNLYGLWLDWLDARTSNAGAAPRIGLIGIESTAAGGSNSTGANLTGDGTGAGAHATGGATGPGVIGDGTAGTGYGVIAEAATNNPNSAALRVVPQTQQPSIAARGDIYVRSTDGQPFIFDGATWRFLLTTSNLVFDPFVTVGDGVNSFGDFNGADQTPFVNAIAALPSGGIIFVKHGVWVFTAKLSLGTAKIRLVGESAEACAISGAVAGDALVEINAVDCEVGDLSVTQTSATVDSEAISVTANGTRARVHCTLDHTGDPALGGSNRISLVRIKQATDVDVWKCKFKQNRATNSKNYCVRIDETLGGGSVVFGQFRIRENLITTRGVGVQSPYFLASVTANGAGAILQLQGLNISDNMDDLNGTNALNLVDLLATKTVGTAAQIQDVSIHDNVCIMTNSTVLIVQTATGGGASIFEVWKSGNVSHFAFGDTGVQYADGGIKDTGPTGNYGNPANTLALTNDLRATGFPKSWGSVTTDGVGGVAVDDGMNCTASLPGANVLRISFPAHMASVNYATNPKVFAASPAVQTEVSVRAVDHFDILIQELSAPGGAGALVVTAIDPAATALTVMFDVFSKQ